MHTHLVITATGRDRPGVVERFTRTLVDHHGNVVASRMARLGGEFAMLMMVSAPADHVQSLRASVERIADDGFDVHSCLTDPAGLAQDAGRSTCSIEVKGADHLGIIHHVAQYLADNDINVESMDTQVVAAPMSGAPLFVMEATISLPPALSVDQMRGPLVAVGDDLGVDVEVTQAR